MTQVWVSLQRWDTPFKALCPGTLQDRDSERLATVQLGLVSTVWSVVFVLFLERFPLSPASTQAFLSAPAGEHLSVQLAGCCLCCCCL